jgi:hypothetical protein
MKEEKVFKSGRESAGSLRTSSQAQADQQASQDRTSADSIGRSSADQQETLFSGYRIESNNNNEIWLEINVEALLRVLKSCDSSGKLPGSSGHAWNKLSDSPHRP